MAWLFLSLTLSVALIAVSITSSNRYCEKVRGVILRYFGRLFESMTRYVPTSLRRTYPAVIALVVADFALLLYPGDTYDLDNAILDTWAVTAIILFVLGWITNHKEITFNALWVNAGLWAGVSSDIIFYDYQNDTRISLVTVQLTLFCVSYMILSVSSWWLMRIDPNIHTETRFFTRRGNG